EFYLFRLNEQGELSGAPFYGFEGANVESTLAPALLNGKKTAVTGDGYAVIYKNTEAAELAPIEVMICSARTDDEIARLAADPARAVSVTGKDGSYTLVPVEGTDSLPYPEDSFYYRAVIEEETADEDRVSYFFNPHFAATVSSATKETQLPSLDKDSLIRIRSCRQLNHLSKGYDVLRPSIGAAVIGQERDLDYALYQWSSFTSHGTVTEQPPIASSMESSFDAVFDGSSHLITHVGIRTVRGDLVGLFGCIGETGVVKNVLFASEYDPQNESSNYAVRRTSLIGSNDRVFIGSLCGYNKGTVTNCAAAGFDFSGNAGTLHAYANSTVYAGGFAGGNEGTIADCQVSLPKMSLAQKYAVCRAGGFTGINQSSGTIRNCYSIGVIEVISTKGGDTVISGFAGENKGRIYGSYCAQALVASGETTRSSGFAPKGGYASGCSYLDNGTYIYIKNLYSYNAESGDTIASPISYDGLRSDSFAGGARAAAEGTFFCANTQSATHAYPYRAVVTDADPNSTAKGSYLHLGDWQDDSTLGTMGVFYWEHEEKGSNDGYHMTYIGVDPMSGALITNTSLCNSHEDGGVITEYGYGYYTEGTLSSSVSVIWTDLACSGQAAAQNCNRAASDDLKRQMESSANAEHTYQFYAYTTGHDTSYTDPMTGAADYLYLSGASSANVKNGSLTLRAAGKSYTFTLSP
ncbi:MAG: hypothetical protein HUJ80_06210, partial [Firmicutes bacterium]|nr:hypothetical protein [Bacillota bacterium]